ncbi:unnamed protein product [Chrysoparadoxa australica]
MSSANFLALTFLVVGLILSASDVAPVQRVLVCGTIVAVASAVRWRETLSETFSQVRRLQQRFCLQPCDDIPELVQPPEDREKVRPKQTTLPKDWLVYDKVFGVIPAEVKMQWEREELERKKKLEQCRQRPCVGVRGLPLPVESF